MVRGGSWAWGAGFEGWRDEARRASAAACSAMKVVAAAFVTVAGVPCWALLLPGLRWLGPEVVEDVLRGSGLCCPLGARLGLGLGFGCGLKLCCADGLGWLLGRGLGFQPGCGRRLRLGVGLGGGGVARGGAGFGVRRGGFLRGVGGGVLGEEEVVVADALVVVVEVVESEAEERAVGDDRGS